MSGEVDVVVGTLSKVPVLTTFYGAPSLLASGICRFFASTKTNSIRTLSKAAGQLGGFVCGSQDLCDYLTNTARSMIYSTALPVAVLTNSKP